MVSSLWPGCLGRAWWVQLRYVRLPQYMHVESRPFDAERFRADVAGAGGEGAVPEAERLHHTIRWRRAPGKNEHGEAEDRKESNAAIVRWSNGTMSLMIGRKYFHISETDLDSDRTVRRPASAAE